MFRKALIPVFLTCLVFAVSHTLEAQRGAFQETLNELNLTAEQKAQIRDLLMKYRGRLRTDAFRTSMLGVLNAEQVEILEAKQKRNGPKTNTDDMTIELNVPYMARDGVEAKFLSLDIYRKKDTKGKLPVMVMIHGGGWRIGDKSNRSTGIDKGRYYADQGFVYVSINYRLSPQVQHPGHIEDVAAAMAWIHDNIKKHGGDPDTIFVMGHSAGAHLAALVATDHTRLAKHNKKLAIIDGVILLDGAGYDIPSRMSGGLSDLLNMYEGAFTNDPQVQKDASPIYHVEKNKGIPPFLIIPIASRADSQAQSRELAEKINEAGGKASVYVAQGKTHGSVNKEIGEKGDAPTAEINKFVNEIMLGGK